jgi:hypothetical protein
MSEPRLCYVSGNCAYFTTQALEKQWGDDWDDAPYEHNAGSPYEWRADYDGKSCKCLDPKGGVNKGCTYQPVHLATEAIPRWEIVQVYFEANYEPPCEGVTNSRYSVQDINRGDVAWLRPSRYASNRGAMRPIRAGATLDEFKAFIRSSGGRVWVEDVTPSGPTILSQGDGQKGTGK